MKYKLKLQCQACGKESNNKEYNILEPEMRKIIKACQAALTQPQHLICPQCGSVFSVKPLVQQER